MDWYLYPVIIGAGFIAGYINTLAGSGSLITLPVLMFIGLPANIANGTNRIAILLQTLVATGSFKKQKILNIRHGLILAVPAVIGAIVGAQIAVSLDERMMRRTIGILMVIMLIVIITKPKQWLEGKKEIIERPSWLQLLIFFAIGVYGGFIQAGVGIFLLMGLVLGAGYDLVRANAVKVLIAFCFTVFALAVFLIHNQVRWGVGLILAVGNMAGAWVAARMAVKRGAKFVRWLLIAVIIVAASKFLGVFELIASLFQ